MTENWIGGDFTGLQSMGHTLAGAVTALEGVVKPLDSGADSLVHDAGWQGDAATAFRAAWTKDSLTAGGFSELVGAVGSVLTTLGDNLSALNEALHSAADTARAKTVPLGANGIPATDVPGAPPITLSPAVAQDLADYSTVYRSILHEAQQARVEAATALQGLYDELDPEKPLAAADKFTLGILLRDIFATRDDYKSAQAEKANKEVDAAKAKRAAARSALASERAALAADGKNLPADLTSYTDYRASVSDVVKSERALAAIEDSRNAFSKVVNFKPGDINGLSEAISKCKLAPDFLKDIPVVDVGAALVGAGFEATQDHAEGWSWTHAALVDGGAALGGVAAGVAVVALLPEEAVGAAAVGVGAAAVTTCLVIGVGVDKLVHEHWSEDIHDHGVLGGLGVGTANVAKNTYNGVKEDLKGAWHGITSIF